MSVLKALFAFVLALFSVLVGLTVALVGTLVLLDWNGLTASVSQRMKEATGRELRINGGLSLDLLSWHPGLIAYDAHFGNPPWASRPDMITARSVSFQIDLKSLSHGEVKVLGLRLVEPDILLERNAQGGNNWTFGLVQGPGAGALEAAKPEDRGHVPTIERLEVVDGRFAYRAPERKDDLTLTLAHLNATDTGRVVELKAGGTYRGRPLELNGRLGDYDALRDESRPYPVALAATLGDTRAVIRGTMTNPLDFAGMDAGIDLSGASLGELEALGLSLPPSPRYHLVGRLNKQPGLWQLADFEGRLGTSDMAGKLSVDTGGRIARLEADITSQAFDFKDLAGFIGKDEEDRKKKDKSGRVLPDEPFNLEKLQAMDARVRFKGKRVVSGHLLLDNFFTRLSLENGRLSMIPVQLGVAGGTLGGTLMLDTSHKPPQAEARLRLRKIDIGRFLAAFDIDNHTVGQLGGHLDLKSHGNSIHNLAANADGKLVAAMTGGRIGKLVVESLALDVPEAFIALFSNPKSTPITCMILPFEVKNGVLDGPHLLMDTVDALVGASGTIDLRSEQLKFEFRPYPKDFSLFNAPSKLTVEGDLADRKAKVDKLEVAGELAKKLLLAPFSPFMETLDETASPCGKLLRKMERDPETAGVPPPRADQE
ncbi:MAG: AsmA family protein [Rhodospirillales bacterium]|nr:AsmA family protein [Rhodospirillales bacterium]